MSTFTSSRSFSSSHSVSDKTDRLFLGETDAGRVPSLPRTSTSWHSANERNELLIALRRLCEKLRSSQPTYDDEDVVAMPSLTDTGVVLSGDLQLYCLDGIDKENGMGSTTEEHIVSQKDGWTTALAATATRKPASLSSSSSASANVSETVLVQQAIVTDQMSDGLAGGVKDVPSTSLFLTAVNLFDPRLLTRNRRVAGEAIRLLQHGYVLVWQLDGLRSKSSARRGGDAWHIVQHHAQHALRQQQQEHQQCHSHRASCCDACSSSSCSSCSWISKHIGCDNNNNSSSSNDTDDKHSYHVVSCCRQQAVLLPPDTIQCDALSSRGSDFLLKQQTQQPHQQRHDGSSGNGRADVTAAMRTHKRSRGDDNSSSNNSPVPRMQQAYPSRSPTPPRKMGCTVSGKSPPPSSASVSHATMQRGAMGSESLVGLPEPDSVALLDACMQSLLVYSNHSVRLRHMICTDEHLLRMMCSIGLTARCRSYACVGGARRTDLCSRDRVDEIMLVDANAPSCLKTQAVVSSSNRRRHRSWSAAIALQEGAHEVSCLATSQHPQSQRNVDNELARLRRRWQRGGVPDALVRCFAKCYLVEFLLDVALPPSVCSSRYEGLHLKVAQIKQRIVLDLCTSYRCHALSHMLRTLSLRAVAALVALTRYADPKAQARVLNKMAAEGLVDRLAEDLEQVSALLVVPEYCCSCDTTAMQYGRRDVSGGVGMHILSPAPCAGDTTTSQGWSGRCCGGSSSDEDNDEGSAHSRRCSRKDPAHAMLDAEPDTIAPSSSAVVRAQDDTPHGGRSALDKACQQLVCCLDSLGLLTRPNLLPEARADEEECSRTGARAHSSAHVVRATVWASHERALRSIVRTLLTILCGPDSRKDDRVSSPAVLCRRCCSCHSSEGSSSAMHTAKDCDKGVCSHSQCHFECNSSSVSSTLCRHTVCTHSSASTSISTLHNPCGCSRSCVRRRRTPHSMRAHAAECVRQIALYSGVLYDMVVLCVNEVLCLGHMAGDRWVSESAQEDEDDEIAPHTRAADTATMLASAAVLPAHIDEPSRRRKVHGSRYEERRVRRRVVDMEALLGLMLDLLSCATHARAHRQSVRLWLAWLSTQLVPDAFDVSSITTAYCSAVDCGVRAEQRHEEQSQQQFTSTCSFAWRSHACERHAEATAQSRTMMSNTNRSDNNSSIRRVDSSHDNNFFTQCTAHGRCDDAEVNPDGVHARTASSTRESAVLRRPLTRYQIHSLVPYFQFACRLLTETGWHEGAETLLCKLAALAQYVVHQHDGRASMRRRGGTVVYGQALLLIRIVASLPVMSHSPRRLALPDSRLNGGDSSRASITLGTSVCMESHRSSDAAKRIRYEYRLLPSHSADVAHVSPWRDGELPADDLATSSLFDSPISATTTNSPSHSPVHAQECSLNGQQGDSTTTKAESIRKHSELPGLCFVCPELQSCQEAGQAACVGRPTMLPCVASSDNACPETNCAATSVGRAKLFSLSEYASSSKKDAEDGEDTQPLITTPESCSYEFHDAYSPEVPVHDRQGAPLPCHSDVRCDTDAHPATIDCVLSTPPRLYRASAEYARANVAWDAHSTEDGLVPVVDKEVASMEDGTDGTSPGEVTRPWQRRLSLCAFLFSGSRSSGESKGKA